MITVEKISYIPELKDKFFNTRIMSNMTYTQHKQDMDKDNIRVLRINRIIN